MQNYETMVILDAMITEDAVEREIKKIEAVIEANGTVSSVDRQGKRKLAYEIRRKTYGVYVVFYYNSSENVNGLLEKDFRLNENILRWITLADQPLPEVKEEAAAEAAEK
jgi:small subunit ribosomal protein S6